MKNNDEVSIPLNNDQLMNEKIYNILNELPPQQSEIILLLKENFSCGEIKYITDYNKEDLYSMITSTLLIVYEKLYSEKISEPEKVFNFFKNNDYRVFLNNLSAVQCADTVKILKLVSGIQKAPLKIKPDSDETLHKNQVAPYRNNFISKIFVNKYVNYSKYIIAASLAFVALNLVLPNKESTKHEQATIAPALEIILPDNLEKVDYRTYIKGKLVNCKSSGEPTVWVIVHPQDSLSYYIQPQCFISNNGDWKVFAYIGAQNKNKGDIFEVMAILNPKSNIKASDILSNWPVGEIHSDIIEIERY